LTTTDKKNSKWKVQPSYPDALQHSKSCINIVPTISCEAIKKRILQKNNAKDANIVFLKNDQETIARTVFLTGNHTTTPPIVTSKNSNIAYRHIPQVLRSVSDQKFLLLVKNSTTGALKEKTVTKLVKELLVKELIEKKKPNTDLCSLDCPKMDSQVTDLNNVFEFENLFETYDVLCGYKWMKVELLTSFI